MSKKIIYCSDGTWNSGTRTNTNVYRLYRALTVSATQVPLYDPGVGSDGGVLSRLRGGAFGEGLVENVREGYERIAAIFEDGDQLFLFGFSRGAYTARSLGGMIAYCGLPTGKPNPRLVADAFTAYRNRRPGEPKWSNPPSDTQLVAGHVVMVGVWDTVGTLGVPGALFGRQDAKRYGFLNTGLHRDVEAGYHALSLDEKRHQYPPTLWDEAPVNGQIIEQVWFAGAHCDVGGGLPATSLSDITLAWMLSHAEKHGVELDPAVAATCPALLLERDAALGPLNRSWNPLWGWPQHRTVGADGVVANSVALRVNGQRGYTPPLTVDTKLRRLATSYKLVSVVRE